MATRQHILNCLILIVLASVARLVIVLYHGFDGLYGQDAFAYYNFAQDILYFIETLNPPPPFFWSIGYPSQLALGFSLFGISPQVALNISLLMGALLPALVYILAIQLNLRPTYAFMAGLLMAFSGQALQSSLVIMSDIPALFWGVLSAVVFVRYLNVNQPRWMILCGLFVSFACLTRWIYLILPLLFLIVIVFRALFPLPETSEKGLGGEVARRKHPIKILFDIAFATIFGFMPVFPQFLYNQVNPTPLLNHSWVQGWSPLNAFSQNFVNIDGTFHYQHINALFYAYPLHDLSYLSPLLTLFVWVGIIVLIRLRGWHKIILLLGWLILPYLFLAGIPYQNIRFSLIMFPPVIIIVGFGLQTLLSIQHRARWIFALLGLVGFAHTAFSGFDYANSFIELHQSEKAVVEWLEDKIPEGTTLYTFGSTLTLENYTDYNIIEIFYETPKTLNQRWFRGRADYLLLNIWQIENQWQGRDPQANYHWFRDERGLVEIGKFRHLTLFRASE